MITKLAELAFSIFLLALPLFFLPFQNSSFVSDKQFLFIIFALVMFTLFVLKLASEKKVKIVTTPLDFFFLFLPLFYLVSTYLFSPNKAETFLNPMGTGTIIAGSIVYFALVQLFSGSSHKDRLKPLVLSSSVVAILSLIQQFKFFPDININPLEGLLPTFTFLTPVLVYLVMNVYQAFSKTQHSAKNHLGGFIKAHFLDLLALLILFCTLTVLSFHLLTDQKPLILPFAYGWSIMLEMFKNLPTFFFGVGPNNFPYAYTIGKPAVLNLTPFWSLVTNSSTSFIMTLTTEIGAVIGILYLLVIKKTLQMTVKSEQTTITKSYNATLLTGLLIQLVLPSPQTLFFLTVVLFALSVPKKEGKLLDLPSSTSYIGIGLIILALAGVFFESKAYAGEIYYRQAIAQLTTGKEKDINKALELSKKAISYYTYADRYYTLRGALSRNIADNLASSLKDASDSAKQQQITSFIQQSINDAQAAITLNPLNSQNYNQLYSVYQPLIGKVQGADQVALDALNKQSMLDPKSPSPKLTAGMLFLNYGQVDQAIPLFQQAINLKPNWNAAHYNLAVALAQKQDYKTAATEMQSALDYTTRDTEDYERLTTQLEQIKKLIPPESTPSADVNDAGTAENPPNPDEATSPSPAGNR